MDKGLCVTPNEGVSYFRLLRWVNPDQEPEPRAGALPSVPENEESECMTELMGRLI